MKASELIDVLNQLIKEFGDREVHYHGWYDPCPIEEHNFLVLGEKYSCMSLDDGETIFLITDDKWRR
jgi:hypothetical protein